MIAFNSILTLVLFLVFLGIVIWAWSSKRKKQFDEAARLPLDDDLLEKTERNNG
jgi:cytochrome c oxidase cbb3-type subunit 4